ncbi:MAG TPA: heavy metal sensor histidine kinase [Methylomirabilota bacterium]|nr:heavy metal sensor histidine kinase [Methylomirabilota bacterium]
MTGARLRLSLRTTLTLWYSAILLTILVAMGAVSYSWLSWSLHQDLDASLLTVAQVIKDTGSSDVSGESDSLLRQLLGPELYDKFFRLLDPEGHPHGPRAGGKQDVLPLSPQARARAARGQSTFETVELPGPEWVRLLTMPVVREGHVTGMIQVGMALRRTLAVRDRYFDTLMVLIPLGVGLAALGGAMIARIALRPVDEMASTARRITAEDLSRRVEGRGSGDELDRLADTLNGMLARLEDAFGQTRRFAADAAHELRTPLTALRGGIEVALRMERTPEEYRRVLASSLEEVQRLIRLAEDLLLLSRSLAGPDGARGPVDLEPLVLEVFELGARVGQAAGVAVRVDATAPLTARGDGGALRRALLNLVENAVKYTPRGGKVEIALAGAAGVAEITVADTGIGIEPAEIERIFEPFHRLEAARAHDTGGAGLGLAIARSIVIAHGGTITVESTPGAGSRFTVRLPLA